MHSTGPSSLRVQSAFKHSPEDCGRYQTPVEIITGSLEDEGADFIRNPGNLNLTCEHSSIHIRESRQVFIHVFVPVFRLCVQNLEQFYECLSEILCLELRHVVVEHVFCPEYTCILGI